MDTLARAPGGQMRGAATQAMSDIVEERQQSRYAPFAAAPLWAAARRAASRSSRWSLLLAPHIPPRVLLVARASPAALGSALRQLERDPSPNPARAFNSRSVPRRP